MNTQTMRLAGWVLAIGFSGSAQAALQGRDLNGSAGSFEAYYDTVLDITWLADANYAKTSGYDADGLMTWPNATTWAANLSITDTINNILYDNWRLPSADPVNGTSLNINYSVNGSTDYGYNITSPQSEMAHLFYVTLGNPGDVTPTGVYRGCYVNAANTCLDNIGPFANFQIWSYWTGTSTPSTTQAFIFHPYDGRQWTDYKSSDVLISAWAVSSGDVAITGVPMAVPEPEAWGLMFSGLGLVGWAARRRTSAK
jgi:hypothetical protein